MNRSNFGAQTFLASMESDLQNTLEFEFGIVGDQLELSDDESLFSQVAVEATQLELQVLQHASFAAWKEDTAGEFQHFLKDLLMELQPRHDDHLARVNIVTRLTSTINLMASLRGAILSPFGSFESNLYTRWADLDLSLELPDREVLLQPISKKVKARILSALSRTLTRKGEARHLQFIPHARVPLITFEDSQHSILCDISVDNDAAILKSRLLRWICEVDSRCRDLIFLVKFWAKAHKINDPKVGTFNSFALCLLVIFHLQTRSPPILPPLSSVLDDGIAKHLKGCENVTDEACKDCWERIQPFVVQKFGAQNKNSVGELFVTFINQFSAVKELWAKGLAICTFTGAWGDRNSTSTKWRSKRYMMAIEDPLDRSENCARSVQYNTFDLIASAFESTSKTMARAAIDVQLPSLLESIFLWPVSTQELGLPAWLSKVLSKDARNRQGQFGWTAMRVAQCHQPHQYNTKSVSLDVFLEKGLDSQLRERLQLDDDHVTAAQKRRKRRKKKVRTVGATALGGVVGLAANNADLQSGQTNGLHVERVARKANKTKATQKYVFPREGLLPSLMDYRVPATDALGSDLCARNELYFVRGESRALAAEVNLTTGETHHHSQAARTQSIKGLKVPGVKRLPMDLQTRSFMGPMYAGDSHLMCSNEGQHGDPWPAIGGPSSGGVAMGHTETSNLNVPEPQTLSIEEKSYASASMTAGRQRNRQKKGLPGLSDSAGAPKLGNDAVRRKGGPILPSPVVPVGNRVWQGDGVSQSRRQVPRAAKVWTPQDTGQWNTDPKHQDYEGRNVGQRNTDPKHHDHEVLPGDVK